jgi:hypothetical protein
MSISILDRYVSGECEQVWRELVALGEAVRQPDTLRDAQSVAGETMRRVKENIARLIPRLHSFGFAFAFQPDPSKRLTAWWGDSEPVYELPRANTSTVMDEAERDVGPVPLSVRAWYEVVGAVNLIGSHPDWPDIEVIDPLVVGPVDVFDGIAEEYRLRLEDAAEHELDDYRFRLPIAPDNYHKANCSGGEPYGVEFPSPCADVLFDGGPLTFVGYLRNAFRWGYFPGFEGVEVSCRPVEHLARLTQDLLPL